MSSELPSASGKSVFSMFGFGSSHYSEGDDFCHPLETAPESFDASNSLTALTKKKKKALFQEEVVTIQAHDDARKVRGSLPDQPGLLLQSFSPAAGKPTSNQQPPHHHHHQQPVPHIHVRRYSTSQEETDDVLNSSGVLAKFNNTLTQTTYMLAKPGGSSTNIYNKFDDPTTNTDSTPASGSILMRVKSSPHLSLLPSFLGSPPKESLLGSQLIRRNLSQNDLLENSENKEGNDNCKDVAVISSHKSDTSKFDTNITQASVPQSSGFGILSKTRQFGAWLTQATEGEKVEVTKKDLNVLAPNSF